MRRLLLATANPHKVQELHALFRDGPASRLDVIGLSELPHAPPPEPAETGTTFEANARLKASCYARATGEWCLSDDSGLEVDALQGSPGVISSHYATDGRETNATREQRDAANNSRVLRELERIPPDERTARFVCVMALADPEGRVRATSRGTLEGRIGVPPHVPRGTGGFGYDPLFLVAAEPHRFALTSAELSPAEKNRLSHRGQAARLMAPQLLAWLDAD